MTVIIEKFELKHLSQVVHTEKECFTHPWSEKSLKEQLTNKLARFFVAIDNDDGTVLGYIGMHAIIDGGYITNVAVLPAYRRNGVGDMLVKAEIECARREKLDFVTLEVRPSNENARRLYLNNGFKEVGRRKGFYRDPIEDGIIMTLTFE